MNDSNIGNKYIHTKNFNSKDRWPELCAVAAKHMNWSMHKCKRYILMRDSYGADSVPDVVHSSSMVNHYRYGTD